MKCQICGIEFKIITWKHLWYKHSITIDDYDKEYGKIQHATTNSTDESRKKASITKKKNKITAWNKGLTKDNNASMKRLSESRMGASNPVHKIKDKEKWKQNVAEGLKDHHSFIRGKTYEELYGEELAKKLKTRLSEDLLAREVFPHTGHKHSEATKEKLRKSAVEQMSKYKMHVSKLQQEFFNELIKRFGNKYEIVIQYPFEFYTIDIAIPNIKLAIEVDGDFWHVNSNKGYEIKYNAQKRNIKNDKAKNSFILNKKWNLVRFWESDITENKEECFCKLLEIFKKSENIL